MKRYTLYSVKSCAPCVRVKQYLDNFLPNWENEIEYLDVSAINKDEWASIKQRYNVPFVPFIIMERKTHPIASGVGG